MRTKSANPYLSDYLLKDTCPNTHPNQKAPTDANVDDGKYQA
jgi:hypothetical protein